MIITWRMGLIMIGLTLLMSVFLMLTSQTPAYTDAYYYYNAGARLASGEGLTDAYLWVYVNAPDEIPTESNRYWMPLASLAAALPMAIFGTGFQVAQGAYVLFLVGLALVGMWLGGRIGGSRRQAWIAGLTTLIGGFYLPFWLSTDTFSLFGLVGAGCLIALGMGRERGDLRWYGLAGGCAALAYLARADGLLFVVVGLIVIWLPSPHREGVLKVPRPDRLGAKFYSTLVLVGAYFFVMLPWFIRSMAVLGTPLPAGGIGTAFLRGYNDIFSYPARWTPADFLGWGWGNILQSRVEGLLVAFQTWLAVEGLIVLAPFGLWALWKRRRESFFTPMIWYALGLHLAMSLIFTFPGSRGGLFHSSAALFPFWVALGLAGVDDGITRMARWRRWRVEEAKLVFGVSVVLLPVLLAGFAWSVQTRNRDAEPDYRTYAQVLPLEARLMVNDPAAWYYHTGHMGVTLPDEPLTTALEIAQRYCITHLIIDQNVTDAFEPLLRGEPPPEFLTEIRRFEGADPTDWRDDVRVFAFDVDCAP